MQTSDGTPMTRRQYLALVRDQERTRVTSQPRPAVPLVLVQPARPPRRRALLHSVPGVPGLRDPHVDRALRGVPGPRRG